MTEDNSRRRHVKRVGAPRGNKNSVRHGIDSAATRRRRAEVNAVLRAARKALREAD
jgi:hypothetical protein